MARKMRCLVEMADDEGVRFERGEAGSRGRVEYAEAIEAGLWMDIYFNYSQAQMRFCLLCLCDV
jgi:hypothetical protein